MPYFPGAYFPPAYFPSGYFGGAGAAPADRRFTRFFTHRADLWEPAFPIPAGGDPAAVTWTPRAVDVPAHFITKSAVDEPELLGLVESDDLMTVDEIHLPEGTNIDSSWILINRSVDINGAPVANYGKAYIARGEPNKRATTIRPRRCGKVVAYVSKLGLVPSDITI
jgi:hypothetical protein